MGDGRFSWQRSSLPRWVPACQIWLQDATGMVPTFALYRSNPSFYYGWGDQTAPEVWCWPAMHRLCGGFRFVMGVTPFSIQSSWINQFTSVSQSKKQLFDGQKNSIFQHFRSISQQIPGILTMPCPAACVSLQLASSGPWPGVFGSSSRRSHQWDKMG